ncbi:MAG: hypothetical protein DHS20C06_19730 [Hyphobacterium sp.]|nr:MAG: hypothetical protein DHS20C06_19730 [Hyphobacterium sp.]
MIEVLAAMLLVQDKPDQGFATGGARPEQVEESLDELAAVNDADAVCELRFISGVRRAEDIRVRCSEGVDEGATTAVIEQIDWRRRRAQNDYFRDETVRVNVELDRADDGGWTVRRRRLFRVSPLYPSREIARAATANCRVRYDIVAGESDVLDTNCVTDGSERAFARAARNAVEHWIYTRNYNRRCVLVTLEFGIQDPGDARYGETGVPEDPPCPDEE